MNLPRTSPRTPRRAPLGAALAAAAALLACAAGAGVSPRVAAAPARTPPIGPDTLAWLDELPFPPAEKYLGLAGNPGRRFAYGSRQVYDLGALLAHRAGAWTPVAEVPRGMGDTQVQAEGDRIVVSHHAAQAASRGGVLEAVCRPGLVYAAAAFPDGEVVIVDEAPEFGTQGQRVALLAYAWPTCAERWRVRDLHEPLRVADGKVYAFRHRGDAA